MSGTTMRLGLIGLALFAVAACGGDGGGGGGGECNVSSISVSPSSTTIVVGNTGQFTATGNCDDGSTAALTTGVTWSSSDQTVATISSGGVATALAAGTTNIGAALGILTAQATLVVSADGTGGGGGGTTVPNLENDPWTIHSYNPQLLAVAQGASFVAVGSNGYVASSADGLTWTAQTALGKGESSLSTLAAAPGGPYVASDGGKIFRSADGATWSDVTPSGSDVCNGFTKVIHDGTRFVGWGGSQICTSTDGTTWSSPTGFGVAFGNSTFASNGTSMYVLGCAARQFSYSSDLQSWSQSNQLSGTWSYCNDLTYGGGKFVAVVLNITDTIAISSDGATWSSATVSTMPDDLTAVHFFDTNFSALGTGFARYSTNGTAWSAGTPGSSEAIYDITGGDVSGTKRRVAVGDYNTVVTSDDGQSWTEQRTGTGPGGPVTGIAYNGTRYVAVSVPRQGSSLGVDIATSTDGSNWSGSGVTLPGTVYATSDRISGLLYDGSKFVAPGVSSGYSSTGSYIGDAGPMVLTSTDGLTWSEVTMGRTVIASYHAANGTYYFTTAQGDLIRSTDLVRFTPVATGQTNVLQAITGDRGTPETLVAVGNSGTILTSTDGTTWTPRTSNTSDPLVSVAYSAAGNAFAAVGGSTGAVVTSPDGTTWTPRTPSPPASYFYQVISAQSGRFVAVGASSKLVYSDAFDGFSTWTTVTSSPSAGNFTGITFGNSRYLAVVSNGDVWEILDPSNSSSWMKVLPLGSTFSYPNSIASDGTDFLVARVNNVAQISYLGGTSYSSVTTQIDTSIGNLMWDGTGYVGVYSSRISRSTNGTTWTVLAYFSDLLYSGATNGTRTVLAGAGTPGMLVTYDNATPAGWTLQSSGLGLYDLAAATGGGFVVIGSSGAGSQVRTVMTSPDGLAWTPQTPTGLDTAALGGFRRLAHGASKYVLCNLPPLYSADGVAWSTGTIAGIDSTQASWLGCSAIAYDTAGSRFVAVGNAYNDSSTDNSATFLYSTDGVSWTVKDPVLPADPTAIAAGGGRYLIGGYNGLIAERGTTLP